MRFNYPNEAFLQFVDELALQLGLSILYLTIVYPDPNIDSIYHAGREIWRLAPIVSTLLFFKTEGYFLEFDVMNNDILRFSEEFPRLLKRYRSFATQIHIANIPSFEKEFEACRIQALNLMQQMDDILMLQRTILLSDRMASFSKSDFSAKLKRWNSFKPPPTNRIEVKGGIIPEPLWCRPHTASADHKQIPLEDILV